jgi:uncharacterized membrane protein HdeD (DUF308 family)
MRGSSGGSQPFRRYIMNVIDKTLKRSSRMLALTGIASIAFGVVVVVWPVGEHAVPCLDLIA